LIHYYGYKEADVLDLTPGQFEARLGDVVIIHNMLQGEGKGRIRRDKKRWGEFFKRTGKKPPKGF